MDLFSMSFVNYFHYIVSKKRFFSVLLINKHICVENSCSSIITDTHQQWLYYMVLQLLIYFKCINIRKSCLDVFWSFKTLPFRLSTKSFVHNGKRPSPGRTTNYFTLLLVVCINVDKLLLGNLQLLHVATTGIDIDVTL